MSTKKQILFVVVLTSFCCEFVIGQKIDVAVYFESLCPDSRNFIINQLYPNWEDIKNHVNIKFIPFGKSHSLDGGTKFVCQHGSQECKGNRIMSCTLQRIPDQSLQVQYLRCFMDAYKVASINENENGEKCANILGLDPIEMRENCYNTKKGTELQLQAEVDTNSVAPQFVPTIVYNGVFNQQLQDSSLHNFKTTVCRIISQTNPEACRPTTLISI